MSAPPCRFFAQGRCDRGDRCRFSHVAAAPDAPGGGGGGVGGGDAGAVSPPAAAAMSAPPCRFFAQGRCDRGVRCRFSHVTSTAPGSVAAVGVVSVGSHVQPGSSGPTSPVGGVGAGGPFAPPGASAGALPASPPPPVVEVADGNLFSIDVECVATGKQHDNRAIAQIALVDGSGGVRANIFVKPDKPVVSYLTPLTGVTEELLSTRGVPLADALAELRRALPATAVLVGQNILKDVQWLGLREGVDFAGMVDLAGLLKAWDAARGRFVYFGLDHYATVWLGDARGADEAHDAAADAVKSVRLYRAYAGVMRDPAAVAAFGAKALATPVAPSFAKLNPTFEGVCQGNRKTCQCGAPFYG